MKSTINKSRLMKEAHRIRRQGVSMSEALTIAWAREKMRTKDKMNTRQPVANIRVDYSCPIYQQTMSNYYASGVYCGD